MGDLMQLGQKWILGSILDDTGGFGRVFHGNSEAGEPVAIKLVPIEPGADRELLMAGMGTRQNILPILDSGEYDGKYALVMPLATTSLLRYLKDVGGRLNEEEAIPILTDIARGLVAIESELAHRDLKPGNILLWEGKWCISDFGIARYAESSTSPETHKFSMTPPYASPEQWRYERATSKSDVYAFGIIAFELLTGALPFQGGELHDFREAHLNETPPSADVHDRRLATLISDCLMKSPNARPTSSRVLQRLESLAKPIQPHQESLQAANAEIQFRRIQQDALKSQESSMRAARRELKEGARQKLALILEEFAKNIEEVATEAKIMIGDGMEVTLGNACLRVAGLSDSDSGALSSLGYEAPFDVICYTSIAMELQQPDQWGYSGRQHSLWYCDSEIEGEYRWYELSFMMPFRRSTKAPEPLAMAPHEVRCALVPVMGHDSICWEPDPVDEDKVDEFVARWVKWLGEAAVGRFHHPSGLPDVDNGKRATRRNRMPRQIN